MEISVRKLFLPQQTPDLNDPDLLSAWSAGTNWAIEERSPDMHLSRTLLMLRFDGSAIATRWAEVFRADLLI